MALAVALMLVGVGLATFEHSVAGVRVGTAAEASAWVSSAC
jgi:hypothetical protein